MTAAPISNAVPQYQVPATPKARQDDERTESTATKARDATTGKDAAVATETPGGVNIKA